jgi:hypothetical protein
MVQRQGSEHGAKACPIRGRKTGRRASIPVELVFHRAAGRSGREAGLDHAVVGLASRRRPPRRTGRAAIAGIPATRSLAGRVINVVIAFVVIAFVVYRISKVFIIVSSDAALHHPWRILRQNDDAAKTQGTVPAGLTIARRSSEKSPINKLFGSPSGAPGSAGGMAANLTA